MVYMCLTQSFHSENVTQIALLEHYVALYDALL